MTLSACSGGRVSANTCVDSVNRRLFLRGGPILDKGTVEVSAESSKPTRSLSSTGEESRFRLARGGELSVLSSVVFVVGDRDRDGPEKRVSKRSISYQCQRTCNRLPAVRRLGRLARFCLLAGASLELLLLPCAHKIVCAIVFHDPTWIPRLSSLLIHSRPPHLVLPSLLGNDLDDLPQYLLVILLRDELRFAYEVFDIGFRHVVERHTTGRARDWTVAKSKVPVYGRVWEETARRDSATLVGATSIHKQFGTRGINIVQGARSLATKLSLFMRWPLSGFARSIRERAQTLHCS